MAKDLTEVYAVLAKSYRDPTGWDDSLEWGPFLIWGDAEKCVWSLMERADIYEARIQPRKMEIEDSSERDRRTAIPHPFALP